MSKGQKTNVIVIGCSAGGISALIKLFSELSKAVKVPIVVVQHILPESQSRFGQVFTNNTERRIVDCEDKTPLQADSIYFAPPNYHLIFEDRTSLSLIADEPVNFARPAIDVLFESAAKVFGDSSLGVLMTGASSDGARGLKQIDIAGGMTFVQDPASAECSVMPSAALRLFKPSFVGRVEELAAQLNRLFVSEVDIRHDK